MADPTFDEILGPKTPSAPSAPSGTPTFDEILGSRAQTPQPQESMGGDLMDGYFSHPGNPSTHVLNAIGFGARTPTLDLPGAVKGAAEGGQAGWGYVNQLEQQTQDWLTKQGLLKDYDVEHSNLTKVWGSALIRRTVAAGFGLAEPVAGALGALAGAQYNLVQGTAGTTAAEASQDPALLMLEGPIGVELKLTNAIREANLQRVFKTKMAETMTQRAVGAVGESQGKFDGTEPLTPADEAARTQATGMSGQEPPRPQAPTVHDTAGQISRDLFHESGRDIVQEYEGLQENHSKLTQDIRTAQAARDNDPRVKAAEAEIQTIISKPKGGEQNLTNKAANRLSEIREDLQTFLDTDTPEITAAKQAHLDNYNKMAELAPDYRAVYKEAQSRMPPEVPSIASVEPTESGPRAAQTLDTEHDQAVSTAFTDAAQRADQATSPKPTLNIAEDVSGKLSSGPGGHPKEVSDAVGLLVDQYYKTKAQRFQGKLGSAEDIYAREASEKVGSEEPRFDKHGNPIYGSLTPAINGAKNILRWFKGSDASTLIHETGHEWLENLLKDALHPDAPEQLKTDAQIVKGYLGVKEDGKVTRKMHEQFAKALEHYTMLGIAPSGKLQGVFDKFKSWMTDVYKTVQAIGAPISDSMKGVFDRMLEDHEPIIAPDPGDTPPRAVSEGAVQPDGKLIDGSKPQETEYLSADGQFNLDNIQAYPQLIAALKQRGELNDLKYSASRGKVSLDQDRIDLSGASGIREAKINMDRLAQMSIEDGIPADHRVKGLVAFFNQSGKKLERILSMENPSNEDIFDFAATQALHARAAETLLGVRSDWAYVGHALRDALKGAEGDEEINKILLQNTGLDYYQIKRAMKMNSETKGTEKVSKMVRDMQKPSYGQNMLTYWSNNLISGIKTHMTYAQQIDLQIAARVMIQDPLSSLVGKAISIFKPGHEYASAGELKDQLLAIPGGFTNGVKAAVAARRIGLQQGLQAEDTVVAGKTFKGLISEKIDHEVQTGALEEGSRQARYDQLKNKMDEFKKNFQVSDIHKDIKRTAEGKDTKIPIEYKEVFPLLIKSEAPQAYDLNPQNLKKQKYKAGESPDSGPVAKYAGIAARAPGEQMIGPLHSVNFNISLSTNIRKYVSRQARQEGAAAGWDDTQIAVRMADLQNDTPIDLLVKARQEALEENYLNKAKPGGPADVVKRAIDLTVHIPLLGETQPVRFIIPFFSMPNNLIKQGVRNIMLSNPVTAWGLKDIRESVLGKRGDLAQNQAIGKIVLGSSATAALAWALDSEVLTGPAPTEKQEAFVYKMTNGPAYSAHIGDFAYDTQRLGPLSEVVAVVSDFYQAVKDGVGGKGIDASLTGLYHHIGQHLSEFSALGSFGEFYQALTEQGVSGKRFINGWLASWVPDSTLLAQTSTIFDPVERETQSGDNAGWGLGELNALAKQTESGIPGLRQRLYPQIDVLGQTIPSRGFVGVYYNKTSNDPVYKAFEGTGYFPSKVPYQIKGSTLSEQQYWEYASWSGAAAHDLAMKTVQMPGFQDMIPTIKHDLLLKDFKLGRAIALGYLEQKYPELPKESVRLKKEITELGAQADKENELGAQ
jgi:hypothetical protein